ncbi:MAG: hypothetical protein DRH57_08720, partial [Candidatus Cloacimonadota bacterium]
MKVTKVTKVIFLFIMLVGVNLLALTETYYFDNPQIDKEGEYQIVTFENTAIIGNVSEPSIPYRGVKLLLPQVEEITGITINKGERITIPGSFTLKPIQRKVPFSMDKDVVFAEPNPEIYQQDNIYPEENYANVTTQYLSGYSIGFLAITPIEYNPVKKELSYYKSITVNVQTGYSKNAADAQKFLIDKKEVREHLEKLVDNPNMIATYQLPENRDDYYDYLIVTKNAHIDKFQGLADFYNVRGIKTIVVSYEYILDNYTGLDNPDKLRNYFVDKYPEYGMTYVLLAGDDDEIQHRGLYANPGYGYEDYDIPADIYFAGLDGNWNEDGDNKWGEIGEGDLVTELYIGRLCFNNDTEIDNFLNKVYMYSETPVADELKSALFLGELLWSDPTWGGDYMDELIGTCSTHGYTTTGVPPLIWTIEKLYDRDIGEWSKYDLYPLLTQGYQLVNHLGHSYVDYNMRMYNPDITNANIGNNGTNHNFFIDYTQGCYCGSFDNRDDSGNYMCDCFAEKLTTIENGAVAAIMNSRYGWGQHSSTDGPNQYYHRQFVDAIFGEDIYKLGHINQDSKEDVIPFLSNEGVMYWCYYEINIFGDPALDVWTDNAQNMVVSHNPTLFIGQTQFQVNCNVDGALVTLSIDNEIIGREYVSGGTATVNIFNPPTALGQATVCVTAHNYLPYKQIIDVIPNEGPYVVCSAHQIDDSAGNNNGLVDFGEDIGLSLEMSNVGIQNADNVDVTIPSADQYVVITDNTENYGTILAENSVTITNGFAFTVSDDVPDFHNILFNVQAVSDTFVWESHFSVICHRPAISFDSYDIDDSVGGNGNGLLEPGEGADIIITFENSGSGQADNVDIILSTVDPYLTVTQGNANIPLFAGETSENFTFHIEVSILCPDSYSAQALWNISANNNYSEQGVFNIRIGGFFDDIESGEGEWTHAGNG